MFQVENLFLFQEARKVITLDRQILVPYFKVIDQYMATNGLVLGGIAGVKAGLSLPIEYEDLVYEIRTKEVELHTAGLAKELASNTYMYSNSYLFLGDNDIGKKKGKGLTSTLNASLKDIQQRVILTITNDPRGKADIFSGRYPLVKLRYGDSSIPSNLISYKLESIYEALLSSMDLWDLEESYINTLAPGRLIRVDIRQYAQGKNCLLIKGSNILITKDKEFIDELFEVIGGEMKNYGAKWVIKNDGTSQTNSSEKNSPNQIDSNRVDSLNLPDSKGGYHNNKAKPYKGKPYKEHRKSSFAKKVYVTIFLTAQKKAYPFYEEDNIKYAHPLTALYHLSLEMMNDVILGFIHEQRKNIKMTIFDQYGYTDYDDRRKRAFEIYGIPD